MVLDVCRKVSGLEARETSLRPLTRPVPLLRIANQPMLSMSELAAFAMINQYEMVCTSTGTTGRAEWFSERFSAKGETARLTISDGKQADDGNDLEERQSSAEVEDSFPVRSEGELSADAGR